MKWCCSGRIVADVVVQVACHSQKTPDGFFAFWRAAFLDCFYFVWWRFQPVLSEDMSKKVNLLFPAAGLGVLDCRAGGRGFDSRDRTNTQGLKITEKWRYSLCPANDETFAWRSSISTFVLNIHWHSIECIFFPNCHFSLLNVTPWSLAHLSDLSASLCFASSLLPRSMSSLGSSSGVCLRRLWTLLHRKHLVKI